MEENKSNEIRASNLQLDTASNKKAFNESDKLQKAKRKTEILDLLNLISINDTSDKGLYNKVKDLFLDEVPELNILGLDWSMGIVKHIKDHFKLSDDVLKPIEEQAEKTISKLLQNGNEVNALILLRMFDLDDKRLHSEFQQSFIDKIPELKEKKFNGVVDMIDNEFNLNLGGKKNTPEDIKFSNSLEEMKSILKNAKIALENTITNEGGNINFGSSSSGAFATNSKYDVSSNEDEKLANVKIKNIEQGIRLITPAHNKNFDEEEEKRLTALGKLKKLAITFIDAELEFIDTIVGG